MGTFFPLFKGIAMFYMYVLDATTQALTEPSQRHGKRQASHLASNGSIKWSTCSITGKPVCL